MFLLVGNWTLWGKGLDYKAVRLGLNAVSAGPGKAANPVTSCELFMNTSFLKFILLS